MKHALARALVATAVGSALTACGLSLTGTAVVDPPEAGVSPPTVDGSGDPVPGEPRDGAAAVIDDATADVVSDPPDARSPMAGNCKRTGCGSNVTSCFVEDCNGIGGKHWPTETPATFDDVGGLCNSSGSGSVPSSFKAATVPNAPARFMYELRFEIYERHNTAETRIASMTSGASSVYVLMTPAVDPAPDKLQLCTTAGCAPPVSMTSDSDFKAKYVDIYGVIDRAGGYGSVVLQHGGTCTTRSTLDFNLPFGPEVTATVGCTASTCSFDWRDAVFEITPL